MEKEKIEFIRTVANVFVFTDYIKSSDVREFIACQIALESNYGQSELSKNACNVTGMKEPHRRFHYSKGSYKGFANYDSLLDCYKDYLMWIFFNRPYQYSLSNLDSFKLFLRDSGYCPEKDYISKIQYIYTQFKWLL